MLSTSIGYLHCTITVTEGIFNIIGCLPKSYFSKINEKSTNLRFKFGTYQMVAGLALAALGLLVDCLNKTPASISKSFTYGQLIINFGLAHSNHGALNIVRSYIEKKGFGCFTAAYDFYGKKFLPPLAPKFDFQRCAFEHIQRQLDRIYFVTLFPPHIVMRGAGS